jgi:PAS domain S-box-containing protein
MNEFSGERGEIEARLRESEEHLRVAQTIGGFTNFEYQFDRGAWYCSPKTAELFGLEESFSVRADLESAIFFDDRPKFRAAIESARESGTYYSEFRIKGSDGTFRWLAGRGEALRSGGGTATTLRGIFYDISERKSLEARLLAVNEMLDSRLAELREESRTLELLNETGVAIASELDLEPLVQRVTDACVALTGAHFGAFFYNRVNEQGESYTLYTLSGASRDDFKDFPLPRNSAVFEPTFRGTGSVRSDDILADRRYGKSPPYYGMPKGHLPVRSYLAVPVVSRSGEVIGGLFFGHGDPGMFTPRHERIATAIAAQAAIAFDNARLYETSQKELAARREIEAALHHLNETLEQRVAAEIKRREEMEESLRQSQKMEAIGQLTGGVAHDFNNLLTVIIGNLDMVKRNLTPGHEYERAINSAFAGGVRAAQLTQRLLAFARRQPLAPRVLVANRLVSGMTDLFRRTLGEAINIETVLAGGLWPTFADASQLENALLNLAVNARDAMPDGGLLTIETANCYLDEGYSEMNDGVRPGQYIGIFVSDTGRGMTSDVVAKAFEPFFTTKEQGQGTGLGLSQVYGFLKQSDGHIKLYSELGQGTTVKLYLPRYRGPEELVAENNVAIVQPPRARDDETILIVEDDPDVRRYTIDLVTELGYSILSAADGREALALLDAHPEVLLLFTDVGLPHGMNGRQLADEAKRRRPSLKVLFTTGYARNAIVHQGRLDPGVELVLKPFTYSAVATKLRQMLDG